MGTPAYALRVILEQNGLINVFSLVFSTLLLYHTHRGYIEILLFITCISGFIADILLIYTDGPPDIRVYDVKGLRAMHFFSYIFWTLRLVYFILLKKNHTCIFILIVFLLCFLNRELGLTLYTNRLIKVIDHGRFERIYYYGYNSLFTIILLWRLFATGYTTYNSTNQVIFIGNYFYLGLLSLIDIWSSFFLVKISVRILNDLNPNYDAYKIIQQILRSGILRIVLINFIPFVRLIVSITVVSVYNYQDDVSLIVYSLQASMILMYLMDLSIIKIERNNIFKAEGEPF